MKKASLLILFLGIGVLAITACGPCYPELFHGPALTSPAHDSIVSDLRPLLEWDSEEDCPPPEFVVNLLHNATNGSLTATGFGGVTPDESFTPISDLVIGDAYAWDVTARNATKTSYPSDRWQFIVGPPCGTLSLAAPTLDEPADGSTVTIANPTYMWDNGETTCTPEGYHLQVSTAADFSALVIDLRDDGNPYQAWTPPTSLSDCTDYYWRVASINGVDTGPWSAEFQFETDFAGTCTCGPGYTLPPIIMYPGMFEVITDLTPTLEWNDPSICAVEEYEIQLSTDREFGDHVFFGTTGSPDTMFTISTPLEEVTRHYLKIAGKVGPFVGPQSNMRSFFTGPECTSATELVAPELLSPDHNAVLDELSALLEYDPGLATCLPDGYYIDLQTDATFSGTSLAGDIPVPSTSYITSPPPLVDCETYHWRVAAKEGGTNGPWSTVRTFRTDENGTCLFATMVEPYFDIACIFGPDPVWKEEILGYLLVGEQAELFAQSLDGKYYAIQNQDDAIGFHCWVLAELVQIIGEPPVGLARWAGPPIPKPVPACTEKLSSEEECTAADGNWVLDPKAATRVQYKCVCE